MLPNMMLGFIKLCKSLASSALTAPTVPTGINTGVCMVEWAVVIVQALALPSVLSI